MTFGTALRDWRTARRYSQLDLAAEAGVSQRHLSFLETGRSRPSREMVLHLSRVLDVPLRRRNDLLVAAGLAPEYPATPLEDDVMAPVRDALQIVVDGAEPNPAFIVDRLWTLRMTNAAARRLLPMLVDPASAAPVAGDPPNLLRLSLHPDGLRDAIVNFEQAAGAIVERVTREVSADPTDRALADLLDEVTAYPGVPSAGGEGDGGLVVPVHYRTDDLDLRLFTTIAVVGTPRDVTLDELRIEWLLPADEASRDALAALA
ncbi:MAG: helix-turn-helix transcriptional regulator [Acidimicrobiia bacterium]|nr:helix-turn-helix transcriptional regulator [Acidimicrobiia bacterium]